MILVQNHQQQLNGNNIFILLIKMTVSFSNSGQKVKNLENDIQ